MKNKQLKSDTKIGMEIEFGKTVGREREGVAMRCLGCGLVRFCKKRQLKEFVTLTLKRKCLCGVVGEYAIVRWQKFKRFDKKTQDLINNDQGLKKRL